MTLKIVGGRFKGRHLAAPKGDKTRPTTSSLREAIFNICQLKVEGARFLDLFAGSGAMSFEALSRGAIFATLIEKERSALQAIQTNIASLEVEPQVQLLRCDVKSGLSLLLSPYDLIYIDPPYDHPIELYLNLIVENKLLAPAGWLFVEGRYDPRKQTSPLAERLLHMGSRRYGIAQLDQYTAF